MLPFGGARPAYHKAEGEADKEKRLEAKFAKWKQTVETGKKNIERDLENRKKRYEQFKEHAAGVSRDALEVATENFIASERVQVQAKLRLWSTKDFDPLRILGQGAFGVVHLVKHKASGNYYALKQMSKFRYSQKNRDHAYAERDLLMETQSEWCVKLYATFQDASHVYMLMEFLQGGDLIFHLTRRGRFTEQETAFYMAELLEALDTVHRRGFVHHDIKPDNIVISASGHLKLLDFGLCKYDPAAISQAAARQEAPAATGEGHADTGGMGSPVAGEPRLGSGVAGTPQYMAPETFRGRTGPESDVWAVGIITFECLVGSVPFRAGNSPDGDQFHAVRERVENHASILPSLLRRARQSNMTNEASERLLTGIICLREVRLSIDQCRHEPFFSNIDFSQLNSMEPPFVPEVTSPGDAKFFDHYGYKKLPPAGAVLDKDPSLDWAHYEFDHEAHGRSCIDVDAIFTAQT